MFFEFRNAKNEEKTISVPKNAHPDGLVLAIKKIPSGIADIKIPTSGIRLR
jgi:hypothetical protein